MDTKALLYPVGISLKALYDECAYQYIVSSASVLYRGES